MHVYKIWGFKVESLWNYSSNGGQTPRVLPYPSSESDRAERKAIIRNSSSVLHGVSHTGTKFNLDYPKSTHLCSIRNWLEKSEYCMEDQAGRSYLLFTEPLPWLWVAFFIFPFPLIQRFESQVNFVCLHDRTVHRSSLYRKIHIIAWGRKPRFLSAIKFL